MFNVETCIIGLCAGLIGIGLTLLLLIPGNADSQTGRYHCCQCIPAGDSGTYTDRAERISYVYRWTDPVEESGKE